MCHGIYDYKHFSKTLRTMTELQKEGKIMTLNECRGFETQFKNNKRGPVPLSTLQYYARL
jgi:hypothetical protein